VHTASLKIHSTKVCRQADFTVLLILKAVTVAETVQGLELPVQLIAL
jgi:hypothetical protein